MRAWSVSLIAAALLIAGSSRAHAQASPDSQPAVTAAPTAEPAASDAPEPPAPASPEQARASRLKTTGAVLTVFGALTAAMGVGMVIGRDSNREEDGGGLPYEVGVASVGFGVLFAGIYYTAKGKRLERSGESTVVAPALMPGGLGVAVSGGF